MTILHIESMVIFYAHNLSLYFLICLSYGIGYSIGTTLARGTHIYTLIADAWYVILRTNVRFDLGVLYGII